VTKPTSFICERTAEYALVPKVIDILLVKYGVVTPIYPWISREGSNISKAVNSDKMFKIIGLYARRPKLNSIKESNISVKYSGQIIYGAHKGIELGIPMIAGCPLARNFEELSRCNKFLWSDLSRFSLDDIDLQILVDKSGNVSQEFSRFVIDDDVDILEIIERNSMVFSIDSFIDAIKEIKMTSEGYGEYFPLAFMGGYKPVYFLLSLP